MLTVDGRTGKTLALRLSIGWIVVAVLGAIVTVWILVTRADCAPGSVRLLDITPLLPPFFAFSAALASVVALTSRSRNPRLTAAAGTVATALLLVLSVFIAVSQARGETACWSAF